MITTALVVTGFLALTQGTFKDDLLDRLVGKWSIDRKVGKRHENNLLDAEWVLNHQFLRLHMIDTKTPPAYEAIVYVGLDPDKSRYVVHWVDTFGGKYSLTGTGKRDGNAVKFEFGEPGDLIHNTFTWMPGSGNWTSRIEQQGSDGKWQLFLEDIITRSK